MSLRDNIRFSPAQEEDFPKSFALRQTVLTEHLLRLGLAWNEDIQLSLHRETFDPRYTRKILIEDTFVGQISVRPENDAVVIENFYLEPAYQKKGLGTRVMRKVLEEPEIKNKRFKLDVLRQNPAAHLYERLGFKRTGEDDLLVYYEKAPLEAAPRNMF